MKNVHSDSIGSRVGMGVAGMAILSFVSYVTNKAYKGTLSVTHDDFDWLKFAERLMVCTFETLFCIVSAIAPPFLVVVGIALVCFAIFGTPKDTEEK